MTLTKNASLLPSSDWPVRFVAGLFSRLPDTPWLPGHVARHAGAELGALAWLTVSRETKLHLTADVDCRLQLSWRDQPVDRDAMPTWSRYEPFDSFRPLPSITLRANQTACLSAVEVGSEPRAIELLLRRNDAGSDVIQLDLRASPSACKTPQPEEPLPCSA